MTNTELSKKLAVILTKERALAHFKSKPKGKLAGLACNTGKCPIQVLVRTYLSKKYHSVKVTGRFVQTTETRNGPSTIHRLPEWVDIFVSRVDRRYSDQRVTYGECVNILEVMS